MISTQVAWSAQPEEDYQYSARAFYGDKLLDRVVVIDVPKMELVDTVATIGSTPYPVDQAGTLDKVYAITRGSSSVDVITADTLENLGVIELEHKPRSGESYNARLGLALIAGANKPMTSVIDVTNDMVVGVAGVNEETEHNGDYGGILSSGHPAWLSKNRFVVIDRASREIQLYGIEKEQEENLNYRWNITKLGPVVKTPTSVHLHHIIHRDLSMLSPDEKHEFYALAEGSETVRPAILKLQLHKNNNHLKLVDQVSLVKEGIAPEQMGSHHADCHPDGDHIYVGSRNGDDKGLLFVVNRLSMDINTVIDAGKKAGHTRFVPGRNLAIVTNHDDDFLTIINTKDHTKIGDFPVYEIDNFYIVDKADTTKQSHTNFVSPDGMYYYAFASSAGVFFEFDLDNLEVSRIVDTGGVPVQGSFINWDYFSYGGSSHYSSM
jgi:hypothetical protein